MGEAGLLEIAKAAVRSAKAKAAAAPAVAAVPAATTTSYGYTFASKPLGISLAAGADGGIVVRKVKRTGTPIVVGHNLIAVNGNNLAEHKWALADVFVELKTSSLPIEMTFKQQ